jgi:CRP/FNR family transcriptional regulator
MQVQIHLNMCAKTMPCGNRDCPFFELLTEHNLFSEAELQCAVAESLQNVSFRQGEVLFQQGQLSSSLYSLTDGSAKICTYTPDGAEHIVGLSAPGALLLGLQSLSDNRYAYTAIASSDISACKINHRVLLERVQQGGDIALRLINAINAQLAHSRALMEVLEHKCAAAKIASFLLMMVPKSEQGGCHFSLPLSRVELASLLGLSEETVCRQMAALKRSGAINAPRGRVEICDWNQLHAISEGSARNDANV